MRKIPTKKDGALYILKDFSESAKQSLQDCWGMCCLEGMRLT